MSKKIFEKIKRTISAILGIAIVALLAEIISEGYISEKTKDNIK